MHIAISCLYRKSNNPLEIYKYKYIVRPKQIYFNDHTCKVKLRASYVRYSSQPAGKLITELNKDHRIKKQRNICMHRIHLDTPDVLFFNRRKFIFFPGS